MGGRSGRVSVLLGLVLITAAACGSATGSQSPPISPHAADAIQVLSDQSVILPHVGAIYQFRAVVRGSPGVVPTAVTWTSRNPSVVTVTREGLAEAVADSGSASIVASANGAVTQEAQVIVAMPAPNTVLVASSDVVSASPNQVALRMHPGSAPVAPGAVLVSGSRGGVLASVTRVISANSNVATYAVEPASFAQAFEHLTAKESTLPIKAKVTITRHGTRLQVSEVDVGGQTIPVDPFNGPAGSTCSSQNGLGLTASVTLAVPSITLNADIQLSYSLVVNFLTVQQFQLETVSTISANLSGGSISFGPDVGPSFQCTFPVPGGITIPTPLYIGPLEINGTVTPSAGFNVSATISGTVTFSGPQVTDTITGVDGVSYVNGVWQAIDQNFGTWSTSHAGWVQDLRRRSGHDPALLAGRCGIRRGHPRCLSSSEPGARLRPD